jgi:hypothetical protein
MRHTSRTSSPRVPLLGPYPVTTRLRKVAGTSEEFVQEFVQGLFRLAEIGQQRTFRHLPTPGGGPYGYRHPSVAAG